MRVEERGFKILEIHEDIDYMLSADGETVQLYNGDSYRLATLDVAGIDAVIEALREARRRMTGQGATSEKAYDLPAYVIDGEGARWDRIGDTEKYYFGRAECTLDEIERLYGIDARG